MLKLSLMLHEITERICAAEVEEYEVHVLEEKIIAFLDLRIEISEEHPVIGTPIPKTHFLLLYPDAWRMEVRER